MLEITGRTKMIDYQGRSFRFCNQRSREWMHLYNYGDNRETLSSAGCGIFSLCHAVEWMSHQRLVPEDEAVFSMSNGGRGDDGTDRPALLQALEVSGRAAQMGFQYHGDGLLNDLPLLWEHLSSHRGAALCNLRVGHIVALVDARTVGDSKQLLAIDCYSESASEKVRDAVYEVIPQSETISYTRSKDGLIVGQSVQFGMFWVDAQKPMDFNLLHRLPIK